MVAHKRMACLGRSWPWWRWILTGLSVVGLALSVYLGWIYVMGGSVIGCGSGSPCDQVLHSRWSTIAGVVPVSGLAAGAYLAMLVASLFIGPATETPVRRLAWGAMLVVVGAAAGSAVWFTILQKWVIGAFCPHCTAAHITGLLLAALVIWRVLVRGEGILPLRRAAILAVPSEARARRPRHEATPQHVVNRLPAIGLVLVGLVFAGGLAACQVILIPPAVYLAGESQGPLPAVDPNIGPMVGSPEAPFVVTLLFDYTCPHCQQMHFMLGEVVRRYEGKLAVALCPAPLDRQCNAYVVRDVEQYKDSCELVKTGLAVWLVDREAFVAFENWMFSFESGDRWRPRSLNAAKAKAVELVGQAEFNAAWDNPWIDEYLQASIRIYGQTIQSGQGGIPKLVFGSRWVIPQPYSADDLIMILQNSLAVPEP